MAVTLAREAVSGGKKRKKPRKRRRPGIEWRWRTSAASGTRAWAAASPARGPGTVTLKRSRRAASRGRKPDPAPSSGPSRRPRLARGPRAALRPRETFKRVWGVGGVVWRGGGWGRGNFCSSDFPHFLLCLRLGRSSLPFSLRGSLRDSGPAAGGREANL